MFSTVGINDYFVAVEQWVQVPGYKTPRYMQIVKEENGHKYLTMKESGRFRIQLHNGHATQCDAEVAIDGKSMGRFRVQPRSMTTVEQPLGSTSNLFFEKDGDIGENALVEVVFYPENAKTDQHSYETARYRDKSNKNEIVPDLTDIDQDNVTTVRFRMVTKPETPPTKSKEDREFLNNVALSYMRRGW